MIPHSEPPGALLVAIASGRRFFVTSHQRPDGDAIGCAVGMALALRALGKQATVVLEAVPPSFLQPFPAVDQIADNIQACAQQHAVEPQLVLAVMQQESSFNHQAVGDHGERGLMQLSFVTATELGVRWDEAFNIETNICAGTKYLANLVTRFGAPEKAAHHYNGGGCKFIPLGEWINRSYDSANTNSLSVF